jgi:pimeloyl-ACP methyl ester carboxylesterase
VADRLVHFGHSVLTLDLRGHGRSARPDGPYDVPVVADDLATVIDRLGLDRPVVAGQSWGGNVVLELAARHPAVARGIVCVDGGWLEPSAAFADWEACLRALAPPRIAGRPLAEVEGYLRSAHPDWPEAGIRGTLANFEVRPDGTVAPWLTYDRHVTILRGMWEHHPPARYPSVRVPVLLVPADTGDAAWTARKRREVEAAAAALPTARVRWFVGDHDIHAQHPVELADVMATLARDGYFA